ncbi:MAG: hypothetical protein ACR2N7_05925 [Acidimicrobiia bacterium]
MVCESCAIDVVVVADSSTAFGEQATNNSKEQIAAALYPADITHTPSLGLPHRTRQIDKEYATPGPGILRGTANGDNVEENGTPYEVQDEVRADHVTISQGGAALVQADHVEISQGGAQAVETKELSISQGGALLVDTESADFNMSGAAVLNADTVTMQSAGVGLTVADTVKAENTVIGFLFAGTIEGEPDVKIDARTAAAFGAGLAIALFILRRVFRG